MYAGRNQLTYACMIKWMIKWMVGWMDDKIIG
jgi:hypothetical protein